MRVERRKLKREGTNLLAGRALRRGLHPFVPAELGGAFDLDIVLRFGSIPVIWQAPSRRDALAPTFRCISRRRSRRRPCRTHGSVAHGPTKAVEDNGPDNSDLDSLILTPRKAAPTFNVDARAIPEPDSN